MVEDAPFVRLTLDEALEQISELKRFLVSQDEASAESGLQCSEGSLAELDAIDHRTM